MAHVPVSQSAVHEFEVMLNDVNRLLGEAKHSAPETAPGKLAEAENKLSTIQTMLCPFIVFA